MRGRWADYFDWLEEDLDQSTEALVQEVVDNGCIGCERYVYTASCEAPPQSPWTARPPTDRDRAAQFIEKLRDIEAQAARKRDAEIRKKLSEKAAAKERERLAAIQKANEEWLQRQLMEREGLSEALVLRTRLFGEMVDAQRRKRALGWRLAKIGYDQERLDASPWLDESKALQARIDKLSRELLALRKRWGQHSEWPE